MEHLPGIIPLFPLPNVVLFPDVPLPLHIFEPRYREMVRDASAGHELVGMILMREGGPQDYPGNPEIFEIGCAGRIVSVEPLPDGRFNILLRGLREFRVRRQIFDRAYRCAEVEWISVQAESLEPSLRSSLAEKVVRLIHHEGDSPALRLLGDPAVPDHVLVNFVSYALNLEPREKQALLQEASIGARAHRLVEIVDFYLEGHRLAAGGASDRQH